MDDTQNTRRSDSETSSSGMNMTDEERRKRAQGGNSQTGIPNDPNSGESEGVTEDDNTVI